MAWPSNISCDWSISLKCSRSECLSDDPVGQLTPIWFYCCALQIVPIKIVDKLAIKIAIKIICEKMACMFYFAHCINVIFNSLLVQLVKCDVHTTRKIKFIHPIFCHIFYLLLAMLWEADTLLAASVRVCVRQCVCVSMQKLKKYWSEIGVTWLECVL